MIRFQTVDRPEKGRVLCQIQTVGPAASCTEFTEIFQQERVCFIGACVVGISKIPYFQSIFFTCFQLGCDLCGKIFLRTFFPAERRHIRMCFCVQTDGMSVFLKRFYFLCGILIDFTADHKCGVSVIFFKEGDRLKPSVEIAVIECKKYDPVFDIIQVHFSGSLLCFQIRMAACCKHEREHTGKKDFFPLLHV